MPTCYFIIVAVIYYLHGAIAVCEALQKIQIPDPEGPLSWCRLSVREVSNKSLKCQEGLCLWEAWTPVWVKHWDAFGYVKFSWTHFARLDPDLVEWQGLEIRWSFNVPSSPNHFMIPLYVGNFLGWDIQVCCVSSQAGEERATHQSCFEVVSWDGRSCGLWSWQLLAGSSSLSHHVATPQFSAILYWRWSNGMEGCPQKNSWHLSIGIQWHSRNLRK